MNLNNLNTNIQRQIATAMLSCLLLVFVAADMTAQGWEKIYGTGAIDEGISVLQTQDEGYAVSGTSSGDFFILKTDPDGNQIWMNAYGDSNFFELGNDMVVTEDGSFVVIGTRTEGVDNKSIVVFKASQNGDMIWEKAINPTEATIPVEGSAIATTNDGGFIISGNIDTIVNNRDIYVAKLDANGDVVWDLIQDFSFLDQSYDIISTSDGGFLVVGSKKVDNSIFTDVFVWKINASGQEEWLRTYDINNNFDEAYAAIETTDNHFVITGFTGTATNGWDIFFRKITSAGDFVDFQTYGNSNDDIGYAISETNDNGFIITGLSDISTSNGDVILIKTDAQGNELWSRNHGRSYDGISNDIGYAVNTTMDNGYIITGNFTKLNFFDTDIYLIKTDSLGNIYSNYIEGNIYKDINHNCIPENGENGIKDWIIVAEGTKTFYGTSNENGDYSILVDTGNYNVRLITPQYWDACVPDYNITFDSFYDTLQVDFAIHSNIPCALMEVDLATTRTRPCEESVYHVNYCNHGTVITSGAYVQITLDERQELISSPVPYIADSDIPNKFLFIIGDVEALECDAFTFTAALSCDGNFLEATCVEANIYPDQSCLDDDPQWDGSSLAVTGACDVDSVRFQIQNVGEGDMLSQNQNYIVIEDHLIYRQGPVGTLESGATKTLEAIPATGSTYRLVVEQSNGHPGLSYPTVAVEGCNDGSGDNIYGELTQFPEDDADWAVSVDCHENAISLAFEVLEGMPKGFIQDTCYIEQGTDIKYQINFQNTDVQTATRVVVRDTIPAELDITTIRPGASSHPYDFEVYNNGVVKFTFENIQLPGSPVDELNATGFVKFRISQKPGIAPGTRVINRSAIYMQYEVPQKTGFAKHTITASLLDVLVTSVVEYPAPGFSGIEVFPNPFSESCTFEIDSDQVNEIDFAVFDLTGKMLRTETHRAKSFNFSRNNLPAGAYVFRISSKGKLLGTGKLLIQ